MIEPMKKVTLLISAGEKTPALKKLRKLGVLHIKHSQPPVSEDVDAIKNRITASKKALNFLKTEAPGKQKKLKNEAGDLVNEIVDLDKKMAETEAALEEARTRRAFLKQWGDPSASSLRLLAEKGLHVWLFQADKKTVKKLPDEKMIKVLHEDSAVYLVQFAESEEDKLDLKEIRLPDIEAGDIDKEIRYLNSEKQKMIKLKNGYRAYTDAITGILADLQKQLELGFVAAGMGMEDPFAYVQGFCPENRINDLKNESAASGWGIILEDPENPLEVPTLLKNKKISRIIEPLFQFMGTLPGYHEIDVSFVFLLFFSLFYAMIIGDAGYGVVFLLATAYLRSKNRRAPFEPFALFYVLSVTTIIWGLLTGTWFGSRAIAAWPPLNRFIIEPMFSFNESREATLFMMRFSFMLGLLHLTVAHFIAFLKKLPGLKAVAELGWILICSAMFFVVDLLVLSKPFPRFAMVLFVAGVSMVGLFTNFQKNPIKMLGSFLGTVANSIQDIISAFSDIVSYIRLFAVGLAGVTVAASFNDMASGVFAPVVLILGHGLNIVLGMMSVMVHGVRLNMLEFSGHMGQEWTGMPYEPFKES